MPKPMGRRMRCERSVSPITTASAVVAGEIAVDHFPNARALGSVLVRDTIVLGEFIRVLGGGIAAVVFFLFYAALPQTIGFLGIVCGQRLLARRTDDCLIVGAYAVIFLAPFQFVIGIVRRGLGTTGQQKEQKSPDGCVV